MNQAPGRQQLAWQNVAWLLLIFGLPIAGVAIWQVQAARQAAVPPDEAKLLTGYLLRTHRPDQLNSAFVDVDGDLVADAPTDPKQWIDPPELTFAPIASGSQDTEAEWRELLDHISNAVSKPVKFVNVDSVVQQVDRVAAGQLHVTAFSTGSVPTAVNLGGFVPMVALAKADGSFTYDMVIVVPANSAVQKPNELRGARLSLTSAGSHSGFKAPLLTLRKQFGLAPGKDVGILISGDHEFSIRDVAAKRTDAAAVASDLLSQATAQGEAIKPDHLRIIYREGPFPKAAFGTPHQLAPKTAEKIRDALLSIKFEGTKMGERFKGSHVAKFVAVNYKKDWEHVRQVDAEMLKWADEAASDRASR